MRIAYQPCTNKRALIAWLALGLWLGWAAPAFARTATWDGGGSDNLASTAANWDTDVAPVAGDAVVFDGTSTKACTWDLTASMASLSINAGYTNTVTLSSALNTSGNLTIASGTLDVGTGNNQISLTGDSSNWNANGGTFVAGNGTVRFNDGFNGGPSHTIHPGGNSFYTLTLSSSNGAIVTFILQANLTCTQDLNIDTQQTLDTSSGNNYSITVTRDLIPTGGIAANPGGIAFRNSSVTVGRDFAAGYTSSGGSGTLTLTGSGRQLRTGDLTSGNVLNNLTIPSGASYTAITNSFTVNSAVTLSGALTVDTGITLTASGTTTINSGGTLTVNGTYTASGTTTINSSGTLTVSGTYTASGTTTINSSGTLTINSAATLTASGTTTISGTLTDNGTVTNSGATLTLNSGGTIAGTGTFTRTNATTPTLNGTIAMQSGSTFGTFRYQFASDFTVPARTYTSHLSLRGGAAAGTRTFTVGSGTLSVGGNLDFDKTTSGSTMLLTNATNNTTITIGGNWDDAGLTGSSQYTAGTETVTFDGSGDTTGTVTLDTANITTSWKNVTFTKSGTTFNVTGASTVTGALTVASGTTLDLDGNMTMTAAGSSIDNSGMISESPGVILHPATSLKLTDSAGNEVPGYAIGTDQVYATLVDEDENLNGASPDTANGVTITCGSDSEAMSGSFILTETGNKTETFRNTTGLPTRLLRSGQAPTTNSGQLECAATDTVTVSYTDQENATDNAANDTAASNSASTAIISIAQTINKDRASPGEAVLYTVTLTNNTSDSYTFNVEDTLPGGFAFKEGSATLDNVAISPATIGRPTVFSGITLTAKQARTLKFAILIGSVSPGEYVNAMQARINPIISNISTVTVTVTPDPVFTLSTVLGKVFADANGNGQQDEGETGLSDIRLATEEGVTVTTDSEGRFHLPDLLPGRHLLKLDRTTLPPGAALTTEHTRMITATDGSLSKVNFGVRLSAPVTGHQSLVTGLSVTQLPAVARPRLAMAMQPAVLQLDHAKLVEPATFAIECNYPQFVKAWILAIATEDEQVLKTITGTGPPPSTVAWDGMFEVGELLAGRSYRYRLFVWDGQGRQDFTALGRFTVEPYRPPGTAISQSFP